MKKINLVAFVFLIFQNFVNAQAPHFQWAKTYGSSSDEGGNSITTDILGNVYTTGTFQDTVDFNPGLGVFNLISNGSKDIFIMKSDPQGNFLWAKSLGALSSSDSGNSITVDASGNVYVTGDFFGSVDFDPGSGVFNITQTAHINMFILKLNSAGNFVWVKSMGGNNAEVHAYSIALDASGNIHTTGSFFQGVADFDPGAGVYTLSPVGGPNLFVSKLDASGNFIWAKGMGGTGNLAGASIALDAISGDVYTTGFFQGTIDFDPSAAQFNLAAIGPYDIFVCKLDGSGNFVWAKHAGFSAHSKGNSIKIDQSGSVYITGYFSGNTDFDPGSGTYTLTSSGIRDIFLWKLNSAGNFVWAKNIGGSSSIVYEMGNSLDLDGAGNVYITGIFAGPADFDPGVGSFNMVSNGSQDVFILKLDPLGNFLWATSFGDSLSDSGNSIKLDNSNNVYTTGFFRRIADFNTGVGVSTLTAVGGADIFIHKLGQCNTPIAPFDVTPLTKKTICNNMSTSLYAWGTGTINWYSTFNSTQSISSGSILTTPILNTGVYTYYADDSTCTSSIARTAITVTVNSCLKLEEQGSFTLKERNVYPSPFTDEISVEVEETTELDIIDVTGRTVLSTKVKQGLNTINTTNLKAGVYLVQYSLNGKMMTYKVVKAE